MTGKWLGPDGPTYDRGPGEARRAFAGGLRYVVHNTGTLTIDEQNHNGAVIQQQLATGTAFTLPTKPKLGFEVTILVWTTISGGTLTVTSGDTDELFFGTVEHCNTSSSNATVRYAADLSNDVILTYNGTTTGGVASSWASFKYIAPISGGFGRWWVDGLAMAAGAATPFS